ncbi:MAG: ATP-binding protein [Chloroflexota bacterium]|nr:MAG: ATP-binding protein [Chloroflexota bacterium]
MTITIVTITIVQMKRATFLDRAAETRWLNEGWNGQPQFRILYGRRRIGKSALIDAFAAGRRSIVYQAAEGTTADHLRDLTATLAEFADDPVLRAGPLPNWSAALAYVARLAAREPLLFVIDEYQYAAEADDSLASVVQRWWSREIEAGPIPLYFVICGSYVRLFERKVLNGPMYGRNTGIWKLSPLKCADASLFFPAWSAEDRIRAYAVLGGIPYYLSQFDLSRGLAWNIANRVTRKGAALFEEAELVVREELRDPGLYFSILRAIDDGCTEYGQILSRVRPGNEPGNITAYLKMLVALGFAESHTSIVGKSRPVWRITDPYLRFWFRYVLPRQARFERATDPDRAYAEMVAPTLDHFVSRPAFEEICRDWVLAQADRGRWRSPIDDVGSWWGKIPDSADAGPRATVSRELEVVAVRGKDVVLVGEAKWSNGPVGFSALNRLRETVRHVPGVSAETQLVLFGRRFDRRLREHASAEGVTLIEPADLIA